MSKDKPKGKKKDKLSLKKVRKMIRKEVTAQVAGLGDRLSGQCQVSIAEEMQARTMAPFTGIALTDAKAGETVEVMVTADSAGARY